MINECTVISADFSSVLGTIIAITGRVMRHGIEGRNIICNFIKLCGKNYHTSEEFLCGKNFAVRKSG